MPNLAPDKEGSFFHELAITKMTRIIGEQRARRLFDEILVRLGIQLRDADTLLRFATELSTRGGFEGAVGAMLSVQAIMHGADGAGIKAQ